MLKEIVLNSWEDFEEAIKPINWEQIQGLIEEDSGFGFRNPYIFRGQPNATWALDTTLERHVGKNKPIKFYKNLIEDILPEIETFTGKKWNINDNQDDKILADISGLTKEVFQLMPLDYMTYLRHYGFPSPLLDWSFSPYVAAYFAFRDTASDSQNVAVYQYRQVYNHMPQERKRPIITPLWGNRFWATKEIRSNKRHYLQQSVYSICINIDADKPYFSHHESVYSTANEEETFEHYDFSEYITKYILPSKERETALMYLEMYNINSFSLMGTEESLLETLFARHANPYKAFKSMAGPDYHSNLDS